MRSYEVLTDAAPEDVTAIGFEIYKKWAAFALGLEEIGGYRVAHPTGRMASAISVVGRGPGHVAVILDEVAAPEGRWLEEGHGPIDLKQFMAPGQVVPMHRGEEGVYGSAGYGPAILNHTFSGRANNIWAVPRAQGRSGFARIPTHITPENADSWIIPAMPAWSPAMHLADMARKGDFDAST